MDSHYGREINMYPQSEILAKEYAGNTLPVSISLDKDLIKITECQKKNKFVELEGEPGVYDKQKHIKYYTTRLSYDDVCAYNSNKASMLNIRYDVPSDPKYSLNIAFTKVNDNKSGFWQKFKNMF